MTMPALRALPLAQLVDLLPNWGWSALLAGGMLAPIVALLISVAARTTSRWKRRAVGVFYLVSLPLAWLTVSFRTDTTDNPQVVCSFLLLLPVGIILGIVVLLPRNHAREARGFEVQPSSRKRE